MNESQWKVERQPAWLVAAIKKKQSPVCQVVTLRRRSGWVLLKMPCLTVCVPGGDQIFPFGWALVLQKAAGTQHISHAVARAVGGLFIPLEEVADIDNAEINQRLLESIEQIGKYSVVIRAAIEDGVIDRRERSEINDELYRAIAKLQEHAVLVFRVFCASEKSDARECSSGRRGE